jgi:CBS domain-containing protein
LRHRGTGCRGSRHIAPARRGLILAVMDGMTKVKDIMSREVFTVSSEATLDELMFELDAELVSGAPVTDACGKVIGVVTKSDLARAGKPLAMTRVREVMTDHVFSVDPEQPASVAVQLMAEKGVHRVVVAPEGGQPRGIVTSMDVVRAVAHGRQLD